MKLGKPPLEARITELRAEIDKFIDERAAQEAKTCPDVPIGVIRNILTARSGECQCRAALNIIESAT